MHNDDFINYGELIDDAMHIIVQRALELVVERGLPGDHHFFISFLTRYPGVKMSKALLDKYPEEMTIVLQYQFQDLRISSEGFSVTLSFDNVKEPLTIPFASLTAFADPSVKFGLQFRHIIDEEDEEEITAEVKEFIAPEVAEGKETKGGKKTDKQTANVITLDSFRKKP